MAGLRVQVVKPVKPLRYRLAPIEEKFDNLDKLEKEFANAKDIPEEQRQEYALYLKVQRDKLQAQKDRALGLSPVKQKLEIDMTNVRPLPRCWKWWLDELTTKNNFMFIAGTLIFIWYKLQNIWK